MRYWSIPLLLVLSSPSLTLADPPLTPRVLDPKAAATLAIALERSALVRALVTELESSNVVVHIEFSWDVPFGVGGTTRFITSRGGYRYVRVTLSNHLNGNDRVAILGHELAHAAEIARSNAHDATAFKQLLETTGYRVADTSFETRAARIVERTIRRQLLDEPAIPRRHKTRSR